MLSTEVSFTFERKGLLQHTVDNEVSALARFIFYENLLDRKQVSFGRINGCPWVELRENVKAFPETTKTVRNNKVSV